MSAAGPKTRGASLLARAFPPALLLLLTAWIYRPYLGTRLVSGNDDRDALTYLSVVADALAQSHAGLFPPYVGQSDYRWNGGTYPQAQAPGLSLAAVTLDALTFGYLPASGVLNALVLLCAFGGALVMYRALAALDSGRRYVSAAAALAYVACPGVLGVLVRLDMYSTFLVLPLLPLVWHALGALFAGGGRGPAWALGLALAALWSCHPPVALWATSAALAFALASAAPRRWPWKQLLLASATFIAADAWHLTTLLSLGAQRASNDARLDAGLGERLPDAFVRAVAASLRADVPGALLPVGWVSGGRVNGWPLSEHEARFLPEAWRKPAGTPFLQLGYALWAALGLGLVAALRRREQAALGPLAAAALILLFLLPWPWLAERLWSCLPGVYAITRFWPMQRFYVLLASLAPFCALPVLARAPARLLAPALALASAWSLLEAGKFSTLGLRARLEASVALQENARLKRKDLQLGVAHPFAEFADPALELRLVSAAGQATLADNLASLLARVPAQAWRTGSGPRELGRLRLVPGTRVLVLYRPPGVRVGASAPGFWRQSEGGFLPLWSARPEGLTVGLSVVPAPGAQAAPLEWATVEYAPEALPLRLERQAPLVVAVSTPPGAGAALLAPRVYVPGYRAQADGRRAEVRASREGRVLVELPPGARLVRLDYVGTPAMRAALFASALAWLLGLGALARWTVRGHVP